MTTDGFLYPNKVLEERGLMARKGFPESYDTRRLLSFMRDVKSGADVVRAPVYSHVIYDVLEDEEVVIQRPDIIILEGLNVLQVSSLANEFVSDYFDISIFIDAEEPDILGWFISRFMKLRESVFQDPNSFFRHYAMLSDEEAVATATAIWHDINGLNLRENILPTRERAIVDPAQGRRPPSHQRQTAQAVDARRTPIMGSCDDGRLPQIRVVHRSAASLGRLEQPRSGLGHRGVTTLLWTSRTVRRCGAQGEQARAEPPSGQVGPQPPGGDHADDHPGSSSSASRHWRTPSSPAIVSAKIDISVPAKKYADSVARTVAGSQSLEQQRHRWTADAGRRAHEA